VGGPPGASLRFYLREAFECHARPTQKIILQQVSLGTDMS